MLIVYSYDLSHENITEYRQDLVKPFHLKAISMVNRFQYLLFLTRLNILNFNISKLLLIS